MVVLCCVAESPSLLITCYVIASVLQCFIAAQFPSLCLLLCPVLSPLPSIPPLKPHLQKWLSTLSGLPRERLNMLTAPPSLPDQRYPHSFLITHTLHD